MTVSIINIAPGDQIKPRIVVDQSGILVDDCDISFTLRRQSDDKFWNFTDSAWNLTDESVDAIYDMSPIGGGEYSGTPINVVDLGLDIGELLTLKYYISRDILNAIAVDFFKLKLEGAPSIKFPQTR